MSSQSSKQFWDTSLYNLSEIESPIYQFYHSQSGSDHFVGAHVVLYQLSGQHLTNMRVVLFRLSHNTTWEVHLLLNRIYKMILLKKVWLVMRWGSGIVQCLVVHWFGQSSSYLWGCLRWRAIYRVIHHHVNKKTELHYSCQLHECTS